MQITIGGIIGLLLFILLFKYIIGFIGIVIIIIILLVALNKIFGNKDKRTATIYSTSTNYKDDKDVIDVEYTQRDE